MSETGPPRVIVPYVGKPLDVQKDVLRSMHVEPEYIDVSGDRWNYWRLLSRLWSEGESFMIVEQDILPWPGALHDAWRCSEPWCVFPYLIGGVYSPVGHGCVKYSNEILRRAPKAVERVKRRHWSTLDSHTIFAVRRSGFKPHVHQPPVLHLNTEHYKSNGPTHIRRDGELVKIDPVEWQLGLVPEVSQVNHPLLDDDSAAAAAAGTVAFYSED